jgi:AcrR family transcriptional regulator
MTDKPSPTPDDTRQRIIAAAAEIFAEKGYARATTRAIADAAGVNEVTLFRHFGSKRNLLSQMIERYSALPDLENIVKSQLSGDYRQDLTVFGSVFARVIFERREALRLMLCEASQLPELQQVIVQVPDKLRQIVAQYLQRQMDKGIVRQMNPEVASQAFLSMFFAYGVASQMLGAAPAATVPLDEIVAQFVDIFFAGTINQGSD